MLITFEGNEGAGKTTQIKLAAEALSANAVDYPLVWVTKEPGWGPLGQQLRNMLLHPALGYEPGPMTELMLMIADRANHVEKYIRPRLQEGYIVLCDRYMDSTMAYQGHGRGLSQPLIRDMNNLITQGAYPDLTLLLEIDVEKGLQRSQDVNRMEKEGLAFHQKVARGFRLCQTGSNGRILSVEADNPVEVVHAEIMDIILRKLQGKPQKHEEEEDES